MIDPNLAVLTWLRANLALVALVDSNIFSPQIPEGFSALADDAPSPRTRAVAVRKRGGRPDPEIPDLLDLSFVVECWALEAPDATEVYGVVRDMMHGACNVDLGAAGYVILCQEEIDGQDILDPETHWSYVLSYYHVKLRGPTAAAASDTTTTFDLDGGDASNTTFDLNGGDAFTHSVPQIDGGNA